MTIRELDTVEPQIFDQSVTHPLQLFAWGSIRQATGLRVVRFGEYDGDVLHAAYQMTLHKLPLVPYWIGYIPRSRVPSEAFLSYLRAYGKRYRIVSVLFEPDEVDVPARAKPALAESRTPLFYQWTRIIDLTESLENIKKKCDATTRYNIGLAERKGVTVAVEDTDSGFEAFYELYQATTKRQHFGGHGRLYHETIWRTFKDRAIAHMIVARYRGQPLAACEVWLHNNTLYYTYAGSSTEFRNLKAMNALMWNVIVFGKEHGAIKLDLWGILPPNEHDPHNPWAGFTDFKKGFGGEAVKMIGSYDLIIHKPLYVLYVVFSWLRKRIRMYL